MSDNLGVNWVVATYRYRAVSSVTARSHGLLRKDGGDGTHTCDHGTRFRHSPEVRSTTAMKQAVVTIPVEEIVDWNSFPDVFQRSLGFYWRNMSAWIDCATDLDASDHGMTTVNVEPGEILILRIDHPFEFKLRCPDVPAHCYNESGGRN